MTSWNKTFLTKTEFPGVNVSDNLVLSNFIPKHIFTEMLGEDVVVTLVADPKFLYPKSNTPHKCDCMLSILKRKQEEEKEMDEDIEEAGALEDEIEDEDFELKEEDEEEDEEGKRPFLSALWDILKDVIIAFIIVIIIIGSIYMYTGNWPPVVVVESDSMQHSDDESFLGVIDTGDLVLVKKIDGKNDVITYMEGKRIGHETYGEYGDVLIYRKNGYTDTTPVIHRALIWLEYNGTSNSFDIPELRHHDSPKEWEVLAGENRWYDLYGTIVLRDIGYDDEDVSINLNNILNMFTAQGVEPHNGFITLGDHNHGNYDQNMLPDGHGARVRPVLPEWVVGKGRGELPWFGLIKLYFQDSRITEKAPSNSWTMLYLTLGLIIAVPIGIDIFLILLERRKSRLEGEEEEEEFEEKIEEEELEAEEAEKELEEELEEEGLEAVEPEEEEEPPPPEDREEEEPPPPEDEFEEEERLPPEIEELLGSK